MSKKSRKRNKKILAAIGIGLGVAALASRKPKQSDVSQDSGRGSGLRDTVDTKKTVTPKKKPDSNMPSNLSKNTGKDNKIAPRNEKSVRVKTNTNKVYTDATGGESTAKVGNEKTTFKGDDGYLRKGKDATPMTTGRFGTAKAASEMSQGKLPPQLRTPKKPETYNEISPFAAKNGGRANYQSGGKVKGCGKALRGFGKAMKGKR